MRISVIKWIAAACAAAIIISTFFGAARKVYIAASANVATDLPVIVIDAGHGGFDGGAVAPDNTNEKDVNLQISLRLDTFMRALGFQTVLVRSTDTAVNTSGSTIREKKRSDILYRASLMEEYPDCIYLCIHQNCYPSSSSHGAQVFYTSKNEESKTLAECVQQAVVAEVQNDNHRKIKPCTKDVYLIYNAKSTAVLVECGFLSNPSDLQMLKNDAYQGKLAFAITKGVLNYLNGSD